MMGNVESEHSYGCYFNTDKIAEVQVAMATLGRILDPTYLRKRWEKMAGTKKPVM